MQRSASPLFPNALMPRPCSGHRFGQWFRLKHGHLRTICLPSRSPSVSSGVVPVAQFRNCKVDAASSAFTPEKGMTPSAPPTTSTPQSSAPQRKPGKLPKQSISKGQLPAATVEPMTEIGLGSVEDAPLLAYESSLSVARDPNWRQKDPPRKRSTLCVKIDFKP